MNKLSQAFDDQKFQQNPEQTAVAHDKAALSDETLEQVNGAGVPAVPAMYPNVLLGRHNIPTDTEERKP